MSEQIPQAEELVIQSVEQTTEQPDSLTAEDSGGNHEQKVEFSEDQQKVFNNMAAEKAFEVRDAKRESDKLRQERDDALAKIPKETKPVIPDEPDEYAENRSQLVAQRDEAIRQSTMFDAREEVRLENIKAAATKAENDRQTEISQVFTDYEARGLTLGVDAQELLAAGTVVGQYGLSDEIVMHIAKDDQGPLITTYLHKNPAALETIRQLDSLSAAAYIETQIKPNAAALENKQPTAPPPPTDITAGGPVKQTDPLLEGLTIIVN